MPYSYFIVKIRVIGNFLNTLLVDILGFYFGSIEKLVYFVALSRLNSEFEPRWNYLYEMYYSHLWCYIGIARPVRRGSNPLGCTNVKRNKITVWLLPPRVRSVEGSNPYKKAYG